MKKWTEAEDKVLRETYPDTQTNVIAKKLGRTASSVSQRAVKIGLRKSERYMSSDHSGRLQGDTGRMNRFYKGQKPWNVGMKGLDIGGIETRFKKGNKPHTWRPIGSEKIDKDGNLVRKVRDEGTRHEKWKPVHVLVWEAENGPVPAGHVVIFDDGNKRNFDIGNLVCLSRSELMKRNSVHNYPPEIARAVQLIGALNRKINHGKQH